MFTIIWSRDFDESRLIWAFRLTAWVCYG